MLELNDWNISIKHILFDYEKLKFNLIEKNVLGTHGIRYMNLLSSGYRALGTWC